MQMSMEKPDETMTRPNMNGSTTDHKDSSMAAEVEVEEEVTFIYN
jgi:hypothetical protein